MNTIRRALAALAIGLAGSLAPGFAAAATSAASQGGGPDIRLINGDGACNVTLRAAPAINDVPTFTPGYTKCNSDGIEFDGGGDWPALGGTLDFTVESRDGGQVYYTRPGVFIAPPPGPFEGGGWSVNSFLTLQPGLYKAIIAVSGGPAYEYDFAVVEGAYAIASAPHAAHAAATSSGQPLIEATAGIAAGAGTVSVGAYPVNPATNLPGAGAGTRYFDVRLVPLDGSSQFAGLQVTMWNIADTAQTPYWYDKVPGQWVPMTGANPVYDATNHILTLTLTAGSLPSLVALSGTYIAAGPDAGLGGGGGVGAATPELGSGELAATGAIPLGLVLLYRRRRGQGAPRRRRHEEAG